jgi:hypothetical protein
MSPDSLVEMAEALCLWLQALGKMKSKLVRRDPAARTTEVVLNNMLAMAKVPCRG